MSMSIAELAALAAETDDQTETTVGGDFERRVPQEGLTVGRLIEYIELGVHGNKPYQGKPKPDSDQVRITFELLSEKKGNIYEVDVDGGKKKLTEKVTVKLAKKQGEKAGFKKLFEVMRYGRPEIKHMAQMLGHAFKISIEHNKSADGKETYANIRDKDGNWHISAPRIVKEDPIEGTKEIITLNVPEQLTPSKIFLFNHPNKETWDSLYIDGTRTVKEEGKPDREESKNWLQETILSAKNYKGSPLDALLNEVTDLPVDEKKEEKVSEVQSGALPEEKKTAPVADTAAKDALADLGL